MAGHEQIITAERRRYYLHNHCKDGILIIVFETGYKLIEYLSQINITAQMN